MLDHFRRQFFLREEFRRKILKSLLKNNFLPYRYRLFFRVRTSFQRLVSSHNKHRARCVITGRAHNVSKKVLYSRFVFRKQTNFGLLPGLSRFSR
jgi:ribosomal protein S14